MIRIPPAEIRSLRHRQADQHAAPEQVSEKVRPASATEYRIQSARVASSDREDGSLTELLDRSLADIDDWTV